MKPEVLEELALASQHQDARAVEQAIDDAHRVGSDSTIVPLLLDLLEQDFHSRHEDIIRMLQRLKDPRASQSLYKAALVTHDYLDYDDFFGLARKCTWALADIGTPEARSLLEQLALNENGYIAGYAQKRLDNWDEELSRKGAAKLSL